MTLLQHPDPDQDATPRPVAEKFTMRDAPVLGAGRFDHLLARAGGFTVRAKVYAEGGEHDVHTHLDEDHLFFVLGGQATFSVGHPDERQIAVEQFEGVFVPRGSSYGFLSTAQENLVMIRVGFCDSDRPARLDAEGNPLPVYELGTSSAVLGQAIAGRTFFS